MLSQPQRTAVNPTEPAEIWLVWMGRLVILVSVPLAGTHLAGPGIQITSLGVTLAILYPAYVITYWYAIRTRRVEAAMLAAVAAAFAVLYIVLDLLRLAS